MKIAIVSPMVLPCPAVKGGAVEMLTQYLAEGASIENEVDLYTKFDEKIEKYKIENVNIIQVKISKIKKELQRIYDRINYKFFKGNLNFYSFIDKKTAKLLANKKYDYIIVENEMVLYKYIKKYNKDTQLIYHMHNDFGAKNRTPKYYDIIAKTAKKILTVSEYIKKRCIEVNDTNNIEVLLNCIDETIYNSENKENYREKYNIEKDEIVIGFAGRLLKEKGILELIKAFKLLKTDKKIKLLIVGTNVFVNLEKDKYLQKVYNEIKNISENVIFTGYIEIEKMPFIYNSMDIMVIPSLWEEPFGCVAIEAMAMGVPIIATKSGGLQEILSEENGFLVDKDEKIVENLKQKMQVLINDEKLRKEISKNNIECFRNHSEYHKKNYYNNFKNCIKK